MDSENPEEFYVIKKNILIQFCRRGGHQKKGVKMRQNFTKLLKTNIEKMSGFGLSTMSMKAKELHLSLHDVDEKKGRY